LKLYLTLDLFFCSLLTYAWEIYWIPSSSKCCGDLQTTKASFDASQFLSWISNFECRKSQVPILYSLNMSYKTIKTWPLGDSHSCGLGWPARTYLQHNNLYYWIYRIRRLVFIIWYTQYCNKKKHTRRNKYTCKQHLQFATCKNIKIQTSPFHGELMLVGYRAHVGRLWNINNTHTGRINWN